MNISDWTSIIYPLPVSKIEYLFAYLIQFHKVRNHRSWFGFPVIMRKSLIVLLYFIAPIYDKERVQYSTLFYNSKTITGGLPSRK